MIVWRRTCGPGELVSSLIRSISERPIAGILRIDRTFAFNPGTPAKTRDGIESSEISAIDAQA